MKRLKYLWIMAAFMAVLFGMAMPLSELSVRAAEPDWPQIREETFKVNEGITIRQFDAYDEEIGELEIQGYTVENYVEVKENEELYARIVGKITLYIGDQSLSEEWEFIELGEWSEDGWASYETTTEDHGVYEEPFGTSNSFSRSNSIYWMSIAYDTDNEDFPDVIYEFEFEEGYPSTDQLRLSAGAKWTAKKTIQLTVSSNQDAEIYYQVFDTEQGQITGDALITSGEKVEAVKGTNTFLVYTEASTEKYIYLVGKAEDESFSEVKEIVLGVPVFPTYKVDIRHIGKITYIKIDDEFLDISHAQTDQYYWSVGNRDGIILSAVTEGSVVEVGVANQDESGNVTGKVLESASVRWQDEGKAEITGWSESSFSFVVKGNCSFSSTCLTWKEPERTWHTISTGVSGKSYTDTEINGFVSVSDSSGIGTTKLEDEASERTMSALAYADDAYRYTYFDYRFKEWRAEGIELDETQRTSNPLEFEMPHNDISLEAVFEDRGVLVTVEQTNPLAGTAYIASGSYVNCDTSIRLKEGVSVSAGVRNQNASFELNWKLVCDGEDISDQIEDQRRFVVRGSSMTLTPVFTSNYLADIEVLSSDKNMGTVSAKAGSGSSGTVLNAVMPGEQITLTAQPKNRYRLKGWRVTDSDGNEIEAISDKNTAAFTVPELTKNISITATAEFEPDPSQVSSENTISSIELLDKNGASLGMADRDRTNFTIKLPENVNEEIIRQITEGECSLKVEASDYSSVKLGEYDARPAEEWKSGVTYAMLVDSNMLVKVIAEDGGEQDYVLRIEMPKSSEKEIAEVALLDKDTKEELVSGTLDGTAWTLQLPQTLTADEAAQVAYGGSYLKIAASDKASVAQAGGYDDKGQESWGSGNILCYMDLNNAVKFTVTAEDGSTQDYTITIAYTEPDPDKPVLTVGTVNRTSAAEAKITFTSDMAGTYYYRLAESGAAAPEIDTTGAGLNAKKGTTTISLTTLSAGAKDLYVVVVSNDGAVSDPLKIEIPAYNASEKTYKIGLSYPTAGGTLTASSTSAKAGDIITVTVTPKSGKRLVAGSLKYSESSAGGAVVNIDETTLKFTMPASEISISCTWEDDTSDTPQTTDHPITAFMVSGVSGVINDTTGRITITLPNGTDLTSLSPVIVTADGVKSVSPKSGAAVDLSKPVTYTVTYEDGTTKQYTVNAYTEAPAASDQLWEDMLNGAGGSTDHTGSNTWWEKAKKFKRHNDYPEYWAPVE